MKTTFRIGLNLIVAMAMSASLWAQHRLVPMHRAPSAPVFVRHHSGTFGTFTAGGFSPISVPQLLNPVPGLGFDFAHLAGINPGFSPSSVQQLLNPVPGLGFDFAHLAAINRNLDVRALIDPVTQQRLALAESLFRETPATPFAPIFFPWSPEVSSQPPVVVILQQPPATAAPTEPAPAPVPAPPAAAAAPAAPEQPVPDVGEFVFVRRNGTLLFAVAFRQQDDRIVYVTQEGLRRSVLIADLDVDAIERMNEDRGTDLHLLPR